MSAPFRITQKSVRVVAKRSGGEFKDYLERLVKLIPSEVISLYLVGKGVIEGESSLLLAWTVFCLIGVMLIRLYGTADPEKNLKPQLSAVFVSCISYLIWIYSMGDIFSDYKIYLPKLSSLLVLGWTFVIPYLYKGDPEV